MKLTDAAIHDESAIQGWFICLFCCNKRHGTAKKQLPLWFWVIFFLFVSEPACASSIWDFQEPVTPVARDSITASVDFLRIIMGIYVVVFAVFAYSIFKHRKSSGAQPGTFTGPRNNWQSA